MFLEAGTALALALSVTVTGCSAYPLYMLMQYLNYIDVLSTTISLHPHYHGSISSLLFSVIYLLSFTAVGVEADCVEGLYNLGLVNLKLNSEQEAHNAFDKLHTILPRYSGDLLFSHVSGGL